MRSWKSTIGVACSVLGKSLQGLPVASMIAGNPPTKAMVYFWTTGFIIDAIGGFFAHLFSADRSDVRRMMELNESDADTKFITKQEAGERLDEKQDSPKPKSNL